MRVQVRYRGLVQGVGFRATAMALAARQDVTGWVRNEADGTVLLEAQGRDREVEALLKGVEQAMQRHIESAERKVVSEVGDETGFQIRR